LEREDSAQDNRGNPSKRFWRLFLAFWVVLGVVSLIGQLWWTAAAAACGIVNALLQLRNAPDKPR
jgi:Flp pilus assembly protein TadB